MKGFVIKFYSRDTPTWQFLLRTDYFLTSSSILSHIPPISRFMTSMNAIAAIAARTFKAAIDSGKWNKIDGKLSPERTGAK